MTVGTHPDAPRSLGRAIKVWQDDISTAKELAATEMSLEEKPRKRPRCKTEVFKTCSGCAECEAFMSLLNDIGSGRPWAELGVRANAIRLRRKPGDIQTCRMCAEWEAIIWFLHAILFGK